MLYAKCIRSSQVAENALDFSLRENESHSVYCVGQTTYSKNGYDSLDCVPINLIYDCLRYGDKIAIIFLENDDSQYREGTPNGSKISMSAQLVLNIMDADSKEAIDFVFNEVNNPELVHGGCVTWLSTENQAYFDSKKQRRDINDKRSNS